MLNVPSWALPFLLVLLRKRVTSSPPPLFSRSISPPIPGRLDAFGRKDKNRLVNPDGGSGSSKLHMSCLLPSTTYSKGYSTIPTEENFSAYPIPSACLPSDAPAVCADDCGTGGDVHGGIPSGPAVISTDKRPLINPPPPVPLFF